MKVRMRWIVGLGIGIPILLVLAVLVVLRLMSSSPQLDLSSIEVKELPSAWEQEPPSAEVADHSIEGNSVAAPGVTVAPNMDVPEEAAVEPPTIDTFELPIVGTLVMVNKGKPFGEESFELVLDGDNVMLRSSGRFWFKALIATITLKYNQVLQMDSSLRPVMLSSTFDAPLGFGRETQAKFVDGRAIVRSGDAVTEYPVDLERAFVLGTFSTYAVIPLLYELREFDGEVGLETLVFGGPPNSSDEAGTDGLPETSIARIEDVAIRFDGREMIVAQYEISGSMGTMTLYARGIEMLGLFAGDDEESLFVYRADYFDDGFEIGD